MNTPQPLSEEFLYWPPEAIAQYPQPVEDEVCLSPVHAEQEEGAHS